ncbi:MAG: MBL fold metallo-hydrolase [Halothiobacillaceae bacterium]|nr:MBL fold metallo-hydrolase [Halothiobacillaceae bacterium]
MTEQHAGVEARRSFLRTVASVAAVGVLSLPTLVPLQAFAKEVEMVVKGPPVPDIPAKKLGAHTYAVISPDGFPSAKNQGMMSNVTFVITKDGVVIIDSGSSTQIGEMVLRQIRKVTDKPIIAVFNTHYHGDHWLGNHAFVAANKDVPIYAHALTMSAIKAGQGEYWVKLMERSTDNATAGTIVTPPSKEIKHGDEFKYGDVTVRCLHYGIAHTPADVCFEIVEDRIVHVGDVAMTKRIAFMEDGSYLGTFKTYDALEKLQPKVAMWLPGHGEPGADVLKDNRELFEGIYGACVEAVKQGKPLERAKVMVLADPRVKKWAPVTKGFNENIGNYTILAYTEAEQANF